MVRTRCRGETEGLPPGLRFGAQLSGLHASGSIASICLLSAAAPQTGIEHTPLGPSSTPSSGPGALPGSGPKTEVPVRQTQAASWLFWSLPALPRPGQPVSASEVAGRPKQTQKAEPHPQRQLQVLAGLR